MELYVVVGILDSISINPPYQTNINCLLSKICAINEEEAIGIYMKTCQRDYSRMTLRKVQATLITKEEMKTILES